MSIFNEIPPTAGLPLSFKNIIRAFRNKGSSPSLEADFKNYLGVPYARITCSGTAALYLILEALKSKSGRKTVIIPAYICPSVAMAVLRANLKAEACDINRSNFDFNFDDLEGTCSKNRDILAIVAVHLGGIPCDFDRLRSIADKYGIWIIEDCAQSLGAVYHGKKAGTLGDFSFFSLARGKGLTIYEGGMIIANKNEYTAAVEGAVKRCVKKAFFIETLRILQLFGYWLFYRPRLFWFVYALPERFWRATGQHLRAISEHFDLNFPLHRVSGFRNTVGHLHFDRIGPAIDSQRQRASRYIAGLKEARTFTIIEEPKDTKGNYPFVTLVFNEPAEKREFMALMERYGLGVSELYTLPVTDYSYFKGSISGKDNPGAAYLSQRQVILSTSAFLKDNDLDLIVKKILNLDRECINTRK
jgi:perosamine synthetase